MVGDFDQAELQKEIIAKVGRVPNDSSMRGALTIVDIWEQVEYISRQGAANNKKKIIVNETKFRDPYIGIERINSFRTIKSKYNLSKLIELCEEINVCWENDFFYAVGILVRVILDHIPPVFGEYKTFEQVVSNYGGSKSFHENAEGLEKLKRMISDMYLHHRISDKDQSPNSTQVMFQASIDVLLNEIINILDSQNKKPI